jgi:hypothetical protein
MVATKNGLVFYPTPQIHYNNGSKTIGGRCNNACDQLKRGHNYTNASWCRECRRFILNTDLEENKGGAKICPCCHVCVRRKTRYNKAQADRYREIRKLLNKPEDPNAVFGVRTCKKCGVKFPRKVIHPTKYCAKCKVFKR